MLARNAVQYCITKNNRKMINRERDTRSSIINSVKHRSPWLYYFEVATIYHPTNYPALVDSVPRPHKTTRTLGQGYLH